MEKSPGQRSAVLVIPSELVYWSGANATVQQFSAWGLALSFCSLNFPPLSSSFNLPPPFVFTWGTLPFLRLRVRLFFHDYSEIR